MNSPLDILNSDIGTNTSTKIRSRMFIFADYSVTVEYEEFMQKIITDKRYNVIEVSENFDMQGTLTKIVTYSIIGREN